MFWPFQFVPTPGIFVDCPVVVRVSNSKGENLLSYYKGCKSGPELALESFLKYRQGFLHTVTAISTGRLGNKSFYLSRTNTNPPQMAPSLSGTCP